MTRKSYIFECDRQWTSFTFHSTTAFTLASVSYLCRDYFCSALTIFSLWTVLSELYRYETISLTLYLSLLVSWLFQLPKEQPISPPNYHKEKLSCLLNYRQVKHSIPNQGNYWSFKVQDKIKRMTKSQDTSMPAVSTSEMLHQGRYYLWVP